MEIGRSVEKDEIPITAQLRVGRGRYDERVGYVSRRGIEKIATQLFQPLVESERATIGCDQAKPVITFRAFLLDQRFRLLGCKLGELDIHRGGVEAVYGVGEYALRGVFARSSVVEKIANESFDIFASLKMGNADLENDVFAYVAFDNF